MREDRSNLLVSQRLCRVKRVVQRFAGHKSGNGAAHKGIMCSMVAKPSILRCSQQQRSHQTHSFARLLLSGILHVLASSPLGAESLPSLNESLLTLRGPQEIASARKSTPASEPPSSGPITGIGA